MAEIQIACTKKTSNTHETITHLGSNQNTIPGYPSPWTKKQVIDWINTRTHTFFTFNDGKRADLHVVGQPYVQTKRDGVLTNNLLALPSCP